MMDYEKEAYEYSPKEGKKETDDGVSEKEMALDIEIRAGEWQNLKKLQALQKSFQPYKAVKVYKMVSYKLTELLDVLYVRSNENLPEDKNLLEKIETLQATQQILLGCILAEPQGELSQDIVPPEVWEIIK